MQGVKIRASTRGYLAGVADIIHRRCLKRLWHKRLPQSKPSVDGPDFRSHPTRPPGGRLQAGGGTLATICHRSI
jgi:hypothetical protein